MNHNINYINETTFDCEHSINCTCKLCIEPKPRNLCKKPFYCTCKNCDFPVGLIGNEMGLRKLYNGNSITIKSTRGKLL